MALNETYELRLTATHNFGETSESVWHYEVVAQNGDPSSATALAALFQTLVVTTLTPQTSGLWTYSNIAVRNLDDETDWADAPISLQGGAPNNGLPTFVVVAFRSPRQDTGVNRAAKRLPLGDHSSLGGNGRLNPVFLSNCFFIQQALGLPIADADNQYSPVTVKKNYIDKVFVGYDIRAVVTGQWEINSAFSTQKSRQEYRWEVAEEPV